MTDVRTLLAAGFTRAFATGLLGVVLGLHLEAIGLSPRAIGQVVAAGLAGAAAAALVVTLGADRVGHRRLLGALAILAGAGGGTLALLPEGTPIAPTAMAALLGMANGMGRDRGGALILEQATLPALVGAGDRTWTLARYHLLQDVGHALGALAAAAPSLLVPYGAPAALASSRAALAVYALLMVLPAGLYARLSPAVEPVRTALEVRLAPESRRIVARISALFFVDALGGGFLTATLLAWILHARFGVEAGALGALFFGARVLNALSHIGAAWLAKRIGLVNTMVFTHIPSSLLLVTVAYAPSFPVAAALFLLREGLVEMDVPTRQSYVTAVVRPEERTVATGITQLVRLAGWAAAPSFAGILASQGDLMAPLVAAAGLKIAYDVLLYAAFRSVVPPEERAAPPGAREVDRRAS